MVIAGVAVHLLHFSIPVALSARLHRFSREHIENVSANSAAAELDYLQWVVKSISENRPDGEKIAECKDTTWWGPCPYEKERDLVPMFVIAGQCPGSKCKEKQAMLYAIPEGLVDKGQVQTVWTWNTIGGSGLPCSEDAAFPTRNFNKCGASKNAPTDTAIISVKNEYLRLLEYFTIKVYNDVPRFVFNVDDSNIYLVAMIVEEVTWDTISPRVFKGKLLYQDPEDKMELRSQEATIDASAKVFNLTGEIEKGVPLAFVPK